MSITGTKEKRTKLTEVCPPNDILSNTKARRAWLATELAKIQAEANRDGKIVGTGSYQRISVYEVIQVEGRLRHRGICQCCGGSQVVDRERIDCAVPEYIDSQKNPTWNAEQVGVLVMHGYNRPGDGYLIGKCPGVGHAPLNASNRLTTKWQTESNELLATRNEELAAAEVEKRVALDALYPSGGNRVEDGAQLARPKYPTMRTKPGFHTDEEKAKIATYEQAQAAWALQFPMSARYVLADAAERDAQTSQWRAQQQANHFNRLMTDGTFGSPLTEEIVP
jgi:hypothetical protein